MMASDSPREKQPCEGAQRLLSDGCRLKQCRTPREQSLIEILSLSDWRAFVPETLGLFVVIWLFRTVMPGSAMGSGRMPHPFWIPVLLMSGQYGIMGGLFATVAASAGLLISGLPARDATQDFYAYAGIVAAEPCAWFATALILGGLRTLHIHHQTDLQEQLDQTELLAQDLSDGLERAVGEIELLEHRIATDSSTVAALLHSLAKLQLTDRQSLVTSIADVIHFGVGASSFAIYLKGTHGFEPCLGVEDGAHVVPPKLSTSLLQTLQIGLDGGAAATKGVGSASTATWAPIRLAGAAGPLGVVVCNRLLPSQDPTIAIHRLNEVCRVLAVLLSACPETIC